MKAIGRGGNPTSMTNKNTFNLDIATHTQHDSGKEEGRFDAFRVAARQQVLDTICLPCVRSLWDMVDRSA